MPQLTTLELKDPNDTLDYKIDWSKWLRDGEILIDSDWTVQTGLNKVADPISGIIDPFTTTTAIVWVAGGTPGTYTAQNRIVTSQGRQRDKTITITVKEL